MNSFRSKQLTTIHTVEWKKIYTSELETELSESENAVHIN